MLWQEQPTTTRIFVLDRQAIVRAGLKSIIAQTTDLTVVGEATRESDALRLMNRYLPDIVVTDVALPESDGLETIRRIRHHFPACQVVILTECAEDHLVRGAVQAGAIGFLLKDVQPVELVRALRMAGQGEPMLHPMAQRVLMRQTHTAHAAHAELSRRELDVLTLITQGKRNKEIAATLYLTEGTVKGYISAILEKLCVHDRTQAALYAVKHRLVIEA
jgi:DNA-binding NarL/FixJ family response regulator